MLVGCQKESSSTSDPSTAKAKVVVPAKGTAITAAPNALPAADPATVEENATLAALAALAATPCVP